MKASIVRQFVIIAGTVTLLSACGGKLTNGSWGAPDVTGDPGLQKPTNSTLVQGSQVVVCRDVKGTLQSIELVDLIEGQQFEHVRPTPSTLDVNTQASHLLDVIAVGVGDQGLGVAAIRATLQKTANLFLDPTSDIRVHGKALGVVDDAVSISFGKGCAVEQLVRNETSGTTTVSSLNEDLFLALKPASQAATVAHEALQTYLRESGEANSLRTRQMIAAVSSGVTFRSRVSADGVECLTARALGKPSRVLLSQTLNQPSQPSQPLQSTKVTVESFMGVPRLNPQPSLRDANLADFVTDAPCVREGLTKVIINTPDRGVGRLDKLAVVIRVCHLAQVSMYVASSNGDLATQIRVGQAQKLNCALKAK